MWRLVTVAGLCRTLTGFAGPAVLFRYVPSTCMVAGVLCAESTTR
jgi:hypothetical protein